MVVVSAPRAAPEVVAADEPGLTEVVTIGIDELRVGPSLRERGIDPAHVAALAEVASEWPPIVVNRADASVVDGHHRVAAAKQLGLRELRVTWFDGSPDDSYVEFVRRNVHHGLPLTLAERRLAARRILCSSPDRSDRGIAGVCGLSPRTVARLREELGSGNRANGSRKAKGRVGRDGRVRPIDPAATRARIAEEIARRPDASLRAIASTVGSSPETVRSVRNAMREGQQLDHRSPRDAEATVLGLLSRKPRDGSPVRSDKAFTDRDGGQAFIEWFESTSVEHADLWQYVDAVPLSRVYEIADEARRRAELWTRFAVSIEGRVRRRA